MSNVLLIRHLPTGLSFQDKEQLLRHFGAEKVWETTAKRNYIFASFSSVEKAKASLTRLHQLKIAQRRLVVEYSFEKELVTSDKQEVETSASTKHVKNFLKVLNAWNPSVDFYQPPPVHLSYKYPDASPTALVNILYALFKHKPFYIQTLHLMNKMCLDAPFKDNEVAVHFFKETFKQFFASETSVVPPLPESEPESEISSDEMEKQQQSVPLSVKRRQTLPKTRKRAAAILSTATLPKVKKVPVNQEEVFENVTPIQEAKKISLVVHQNALQKPTEEPEVIGELGKFQKEEQPAQPIEVETEPEQPTITRKELLKNRISYRDMKVLPVFKNYHPGQPSMRLYIKNLAKTVTEVDVTRIYKRYVETLPDDDQLCFDVRVMQEGKMKGQAFVTFPSVSIAEKALNETNGYMLKDKPMVVQFARAANKKSIE
ncbi:RNA-binding region-containing protein 3 [Galleria mellonella]|uniref:RNA-binding region-containing protein 3 n=1 Tax=Galleria mellonella TaxID=7137 RepID=A0A6J1X7K6_GALME|nr:RNA-binding region-containing protein 3 [Galleria mellonella]